MVSLSGLVLVAPFLSTSVGQALLPIFVLFTVVA
jgi:hypothetical protein